MGRLSKGGGLQVFRLGFGAETMIEQDRPGVFWRGGLFHGLVDFRTDTPERARRFSSFGIRTLLRASDGTVWA